jgi:hypothetical protein
MGESQRERECECVDGRRRAGKDWGCDDRRGQHGEGGGEAWRGDSGAREEEVEI